MDPSSGAAEADVRAMEARLRTKDRENEGGLGSRPVAAPPLTLDFRTSDSISLHMSEDSKTVYRALCTSAGINVIFDPDYVSKRIEVDLKDVSILDSLAVLQQVSTTFWRPVTRNTIFVAQDSRAKRQALGQQAVQIFYLNNVSQQNDLNDIQTALRNVLTSVKLFGVASQNAIIVRDKPDELALAGLLISGLDQPRPEVVVDISVMEVSRDKLRKIGLSPPTSLTVNSGSSQTLNDIGKSSSYSISVGQAAVQFLMTDSQTRILQNPSLRATDGQKATLKLGERLPIATGSYTVGTGSTSAAAETQFQYIDVGVNVEMTPAIHGDHDITLKLSVEVSSQSGTETIDDVSEPIISQQKADQVIRLKDGEATLMAGLLKRQESRDASGWPGFGDVPVLKEFFTTQSHEVVDDELIFLIVPHLVRLPNVEGYLKEQIDAGTESQIQLRYKPSADINGHSDSPK